MKSVRAKEKYARNSYENLKQEPNSRKQQQQQQQQLVEKRPEKKEIKIKQVGKK